MPHRAPSRTVGRGAGCKGPLPRYHSLGYHPLVSDFDGCQLINDFFGLIRSGEVEAYNEISLQHELGYFLRNRLTTPLVVEFERPANYFVHGSRLLKKEIDIVVRSRTTPERRWAIELKFPRNGQVPEQMFAACKDLQFLEQLCDKIGFEGGWFAMLTDDPLFYRGPLPGPDVYPFFRAGAPIQGAIKKPTGTEPGTVSLRGTYNVNWLDSGGARRLALIEVSPSPAKSGEGAGG